MTDDTKQYTIGDLTHRYVFIQHDLTNLYDMQAVLDAVEKALAWTSPEAVPQEDALLWTGCKVRAGGDLYEADQLSENVWQAFCNGVKIGDWKTTEQGAKNVCQATYQRKRDAERVMLAPGRFDAKNPASNSTPKAGGDIDMSVQPLDLSNLLRHAFYAGMGLVAGDKISNEQQQKWAKYEPYRGGSYARVCKELGLSNGWGALETIPAGVYFSLEHNNFYSIDGHHGQGTTFFGKWHHRAAEFPGKPIVVEDTSAPVVSTLHEEGRKWNWSRVGGMSERAQYECQVFGGVYTIRRTERFDGWTLAFQHAPGAENTETLSHHTMFQDAATRAVAHYDSGAVAKYPVAPTPVHLLFKTSDADAPDAIKDSNGEVVLGLCKVCNKGEVELAEPCETWAWAQSAPSVYVYKVQRGPGYSVVLDNGDWRALVVEHGSLWGTKPHLIALRNTATDAMRECEHDFKMRNEAHATELVDALEKHYGVAPAETIRPPESFQSELADANTAADKAIKELTALQAEIKHRSPLLWVMRHKRRAQHFWIASRFDKEDDNWFAPIAVYE